MKSLRREIELYIEKLVQITNILEREEGPSPSTYYRVVIDLECILDKTAKAIENGDNNG